MQNCGTPIVSTAASHIKDVTGVEAVTTAETPNLPESPVTPRIPADAAAAALFGGGVSVIVLTVRFLRKKGIY